MVRVVVERSEDDERVNDEKFEFVMVMVFELIGLELKVPADDAEMLMWSKMSFPVLLTEYSTVFVRTVIEKLL